MFNEISLHIYLIIGTNGLCVDATRRVLRYKESTASTCFVQIQRQTIEQCHDLK